MGVSGCWVGGRGVVDGWVADLREEGYELGCLREDGDVLMGDFGGDGRRGLLVGGFVVGA